MNTSITSLTLIQFILCVLILLGHSPQRQEVHAGAEPWIWGHHDGAALQWALRDSNQQTAFSVPFMDYGGYEL